MGRGERPATTARGLAGKYVRRLLAGLGEQSANNTNRNRITTLKLLHRLSPVLTDKGLHGDPWSQKSARKAAKVTQGVVVSTPPIPPNQWFALIRAAWTYVHTFAPDILRAQRRYQQLIDNAAKVPETLTPDWTHTSPTRPTLSPFIRHPVMATATSALVAADADARHRTGGLRPTASARPGVRSPTNHPVKDAIAHGHTTTTGVVDGLTVINHATTPPRPGIPASHPRALGLERRMLRNACL